jgi:hypothetical protein
MEVASLSMRGLASCWGDFRYDWTRRESFRRPRDEMRRTSFSTVRRFAAWESRQILPFSGALMDIIIRFCE